MTIVTQAMHAANTENTAKIIAKNPAKCTINKSYNMVSSYYYNYSTWSAPRRVVSERVAKILKMAQNPYLWYFGLTDLWRGAATLLELCQYTPGVVSVHSWRSVSTLLEGWQHSPGGMSVHSWRGASTLLVSYNI